MTLAAGTRLGPYEIVSLLGKGGMGEVFRARDSRLGRDVAIKVLPDGLVSDPEARERFEREARAVAALSHPNIVALLDIGQLDAMTYAVMELLEGETLRDRLRSGPFPPRKGAETAHQIAIGLAAAHESGIAHRDLKPENIFLTRDGRVKLLDFGLAKATALLQADATSAPTAAQTGAGTVLGTVGYMSPEQVRGMPVDHRTDIFSFGAVLYEMLTGRRAFEGSSAVETMNAILATEPLEIAGQVSGVPPGLERIVQRCLEKAPEQRFQSARDLAFTLEALGGSGDSHSTHATVRPRRFPAALGPVGLAAFCGASLLAIFFAALYFTSVRNRDIEARRVTRLHLLSAKGERYDFSKWGHSFSISPDGTKLAYTVSKGVTTELRLRWLDSNESAVIPGTEGGFSPFFSPDGRWIAFAAVAKIKKVAVAGGSPITLCDASGFRGGTWADDGWIYLVPNPYAPVSRIRAEGGTLQAVTKIRSADGEQQHRWPDVLPGGKTILYTVGSGGEWDDAKIVAERLGTGERAVLVKGGTSPRYLATGHLVYARAGALYALAFDPRTLSVQGSPVEVARNVLLDPAGGAKMDVSATGVLVTAPAEAAGGEMKLSWIDRAGVAEPLNLPLQQYLNLEISPDGTRVALGIGNSIAALDLDRVVIKKLMLPARAENPVWSRDGNRVFFGLEKGAHFEIFSKAADDSGSAQQIFKSDAAEDPLRASADGAWLLSMRSPGDGAELLLRQTPGDAPGAPPKLLLKSTALDTNSLATLSPDARWVAYVSDESGRAEIYARPASGEDRKWQLSAEGGVNPIFSRDGKEIFFLSGRKFLSASVDASGKDLRFGTPRVLFGGHEITVFDVAPDGKKFLVAENPNPDAPSHLDVVVNWFSEVRRKVGDARAR